jgi:hypothetical protein
MNFIIKMTTMTVMTKITTIMMTMTSLYVITIIMMTTTTMNIDDYDDDGNGCKETIPYHL